MKKTGKPSSTPKQAADSGKQRTRRDDAPRRKSTAGPAVARPARTGAARGVTGKAHGKAPTGSAAAARQALRKQAATAPVRPATNGGERSGLFIGAQAFEHAVALLEEVLRFDAAADGVISRYFREYPSLGATVRALMAEGTYGALRQRSVYAQLAQSGSGPIARRLLLLSLADLEVDASAAATPAELEWLAHTRQVDRSTMPLAVQSNLPEWLWTRLVAQFGEDEAMQLARALNRSASLDLRVNRLKADRATVLAQLVEGGPVFEAAATPYAPDGVRLVHKAPINRHPLFEAGALEVQDEGSQLLAQLVAPRRGEMVVDFCAGAGGKTLALGALMRNTGRLYAFDVSAKRLERFRPRLARSGLSNVFPVVIADEHDLKIKRLAGKIDRVLVDAPCSGLGTLRRNPDLKWRQTPESVNEMTRKQASILASASRLVKPGGHLVYATCSLIADENEAIVAAFLAEHPEFKQVSVATELTRQKIAIENAGGETLHLYPHRHGTDAFFAAILTRRAVK